MTWTKRSAKHDRITIDGTDCSGAFSRFGRPSQHSTEDFSGFSVTGFDETQPGNTTQSFVGEAFYTEELANLLAPLHENRTPTEIQWQPHGLLDPTARVYYGVCTINEWSPDNTRGAPSKTPFSATPADENGIQSAAGT